LSSVKDRGKNLPSVISLPFLSDSDAIHVTGMRA
jgi:hypothetical protein